jgi:hypothetical protein
VFAEIQRRYIQPNIIKSKTLEIQSLVYHGHSS